MSSDEGCDPRGAPLLHIATANTAKPMTTSPYISDDLAAMRHAPSRLDRHFIELYQIVELAQATIHEACPRLSEL